MTTCKARAALEYFYTDFEVDADIVINEPRSTFSKDMAETVFNTLINEIKTRNLQKWYLIENLHWEGEGPNSFESLRTYYETIKTLGCRRVILIADLPLQERLSVSHALSQSEISFNFMPDLNSAYAWISYLRISDSETPSYFSYSSSY